MDNADKNSYIRSVYYAQFSTDFFIDNFDKIHSAFDSYLDFPVDKRQSIVDFANTLKGEINSTLTRTHGIRR